MAGLRSEDAVRFYALRLREAGMINRPPTKSSRRAPTGAFFNELKRELKGYATRSRLLFAFAVLASVMLLPLHDALIPLLRNRRYRRSHQRRNLR